MKPSFQFTGDTGRASFFSNVQASRSMRTDYNFQAGAVGDFSGGCQGEAFPSFRGISKDYFSGEARSHFAMEAAVFGLIVLTAAVPVIESIQGLFQLVYGTL